MLGFRVSGLVQCLNMVYGDDPRIAALVAKLV